MDSKRDDLLIHGQAERAKRKRATSIKDHFGTQFACYDNGSVQSCAAGYKGRGNGEDSQFILRVVSKVVSNSEGWQQADNREVEKPL